MGLPVSSLAAAVLTSGSWPAEVDDGPEPEAGGVEMAALLAEEPLPVSLEEPVPDDEGVLGFILDSWVADFVDDSTKKDSQKSLDSTFWTLITGNYVISESREGFY